MTDTVQTLPVLPLKNTVVFPELVVPLAVGRPKSLAAVKAASEHSQQLLTVAQRDAEQDAPDRSGIHDIGTLVTIKRVERRDGGANVIVQGIQRVRVLAEQSNEPHLEVAFRPLPNLHVDEHDPDRPRVEALVLENLELARAIAQMFDAENGLQVFQQLIGSITDPVVQMYRIASLANLDIEKEQEVLAAPTTLALMEKVHDILLHEKNVNEVRREIAETGETRHRQAATRTPVAAAEARHRTSVGRRRRRQRRNRRTARTARESESARSGAEGSRSRTEAARPHVGERGRLSGRAQLSRIDRRVAVEYRARKTRSI